MSTMNISLPEGLKALRGLLLEGAASPPGVTADAEYFDRLRDRVREARRERLV